MSFVNRHHQVSIRQTTPASPFTSDGRPGVDTTARDIPNDELMCALLVPVMALYNGADPTVALTRGVEYPTTETVVSIGQDLIVSDLAQRWDVTSSHHSNGADIHVRRAEALRPLPQLQQLDAHMRDHPSYADYLSSMRTWANPSTWCVRIQDLTNGATANIAMTARDRAELVAGFVVAYAHAYHVGGDLRPLQTPEPVRFDEVHQYLTWTIDDLANEHL